MSNNQKLSLLFRKRSLLERKSIEYADGIHGLHTYAPGLFLFWLAAFYHFFKGESKEVGMWIFLIALNIWYLLSWGGGKKRFLKYSQEIAKIDKQIAEEIAKSDF